MLTTPNDVIKRARSLAYVSSSQYTDGLWLQDYNIIRSELSNYIMQSVNEAYFEETITSTTVVWQNEYTLTDTSSWIDVNKVAEVSVEDSSWVYKKYKKQNLEALSKDVSQYEKTTTPFYYISGDSVFIYPTPTEPTNIKLKVWLTPTDLTIDETDTLFPDVYREVIVLWLIVNIYKRRGLLNEASFAFTAFNNARTEMIMALTNRVSVPELYSQPNLDYYE